MANPAANVFFTKLAYDGCNDSIIHMRFIEPELPDGVCTVNSSTPDRYLQVQLEKKPTYTDVAYWKQAFGNLFRLRQPRPFEEKVTNAERLATYLESNQGLLTNMGLTYSRSFGFGGGISLSKLKSRVDTLYDKLAKGAPVAEDARAAGVAAEAGEPGPYAGNVVRIRQAQARAQRIIDAAQTGQSREEASRLWRAASLGGRAAYAMASASLSLIGRAAYFSSVGHPNIGKTAALVALSAYFIMA